MKKIHDQTLVQLVMIVSTTLCVYGVLPQAINPVGKYVYKTSMSGLCTLKLC